MRWSASRSGSAYRAPMPAAVPMLRLANVEVVYDDVILVLKGLSLEVPPGQIVALLGADGAAAADPARRALARARAAAGAGDLPHHRKDQPGGEDHHAAGGAERQRGALHRALRLHHGDRPHRAGRRAGEAEEQRGRPRVLPGRRRGEEELQGGEVLPAPQAVAVVRPGRILDPALEQETAADRERRLGRRLRETVAHARAKSAYFGRVLPQAVDRLEQIPIIRKDDLPALQASEPPFGGLVAVDPGRLQRIFASPGPILDPQGEGEDFWRFRIAFAAAGFRAGDIVMNSSAYHLTPLGFMLDNGARALGCVVIPAGTGQTDLQVRVACAVRAKGYAGTPSFLYTLLKRGRELGTPLPLEVAWVIGEMFPDSLRSDLRDEFHLDVLQGYGTADLGPLAYECAEKGGMHLNHECILVVLDLVTGA